MSDEIIYQDGVEYVRKDLHEKALKTHLDRATMPLVTIDDGTMYSMAHIEKLKEQNQILRGAVTKLHAATEFVKQNLDGEATDLLLTVLNNISELSAVHDAIDIVRSREDNLL